jgi:hypothetical protein
MEFFRPNSVDFVLLQLTGRYVGENLNNELKVPLAYQSESNLNIFHSAGSLYFVLYILLTQWYYPILYSILCRNYKRSIELTCTNLLLISLLCNCATFCVCFLWISLCFVLFTGKELADRMYHVE